MRCVVPLTCLLLSLGPSHLLAQPSTQELPKIVLLGDSIRMGYAPLVIQQMKGKATIVNPKPNGGDSSNVLKNLDEWVLREKPTLVHLNCGLHDLKRLKKDKTYQVPLEQYQANLRAIIARIRKNTSATIVFATTTPILDARHAKRGANFDRLEKDVQRYNEAAIAIMLEAGVPVHDLHWVVEQHDPEKLLGADGTHYTKDGYQHLAGAVSDCLQRHLTLLRYKPLSTPASGPRAAESYRKNEAERDALVPEAYRKMPIGTFKTPESEKSWRADRPEVLKKVMASLGDLPPRPSPQKVRRISRELRRGYSMEKIAIDNGVDNWISALLLIPEKCQKPAPAILWLHSSTPHHTQILIPNTNGGAESLGEAFTRAGFVVLAPDAYWHGEREGTGPSGSAETGRSEQESLFKLHLWMGRTLWGMFVRDDQIALDYLCTRPEVDRKRIGATGMSMGSTRAWWLAAVDERIAAVVGVACLTRYQNLIAHGQLRQHGVYYWVNGLLKHFDTEGVLALIAPRPYLALTGDLDAGSPVDGIKVLEREVGKVYRILGAQDHFRNVIYPEVGHAYTPQMRTEMLAWFERWLKPGTKR